MAAVKSSACACKIVNGGSDVINVRFVHLSITDAYRNAGIYTPEYLRAKSQPIYRLSSRLSSNW